MKSKTHIIRLLIFLSAAVTAGALFLPIWRIELAAPQYPEGLVLQIYAKGLSGDVAIVNGLNHYIGMATLHSADFIEFTFLPYIIGSIVLLGLATAFFNNRKLYFAYAIYFIAIAVISMADFWRWEYNYGHHLNPEAPIQVPGMAYQPPLIGFKQLLNFGAYSIPDTGGWLFIAGGLLSVVAAILLLRRQRLSVKTGALVLLFPLLFSCSPNKAVDIRYGKDECDFCKMTILDNHFSCEIVNRNGKAFKFDDLQCLLQYQRLNTLPGSTVYIAAYDTTGTLYPAANLFFHKSNSLRSPMGGNTAAYAFKEKMPAGSDIIHGWNDLVKTPIK